MKNTLRGITIVTLVLISAMSKAQYTLTDADVNFSRGTIRAYLNTTETDIIIPESINGEKVTEIGATAFQNKKLTKVKLPESLLVIRFLAFFDNKLTEISLPTSLSSIGDNAFERNELASVSLKSTLNKVGEFAFADNKIENVSIEGDVSISASAFNKNKITTINGQPSAHGIVYKWVDAKFNKDVIYSYGGDATDIDFIPSTVKEIASKAFANCALKNVTIPSTIEKLGVSAFEESDIRTLVIEEGIESIANSAFEKNTIDEITIPNSVKFIGKSAFSRNLSSKISLGNSVIFIGKNAFSLHLLADESALVLPNSLEEIQQFAFSPHAYVASFKNITLPEVVKAGFIFENWEEGSGKMHLANTKVSVNNSYKAIFSNITTSTKNVEIQESSIYPNPVQKENELTIKFNASQMVKSINLFNTLGKLVYGKKLNKPVLVQKIPMNKFTPGVYLLKIVTSENKSITKQIMVK